MKRLLLFLVLFLFNINSIFASTSSAYSYVLMDSNTGNVLLSKNRDNPRLIASITKIMTCILAIESGKLAKVIVIGEEINTVNGSFLYLEIDEEIKLLDLLYGLMLRSGNDAAIAIATYLEDTEEDFVKLMNRKAVEIGMKNTFFMDASGLTDSNYSTSYDMALLTRYAMKNDIYRQIVGTKKYKVRTNKKTYLWYNKNKLLTSTSYVTGGKTGYTKKAGRTLVSSATINDMDLIVVTLNDSDDWNTHKYLYEYASDNYMSYQVLDKDNYVIYGDNYYNGNFYINNDRYIVVNKNDTYNLVSHIKLTMLKNYKDNDKVGVNEIYLNDKLLLEENIYIDKTSIVKTNIFTKIKKWLS